MSDPPNPDVSNPHSGHQFHHSYESLYSSENIPSFSVSSSLSYPSSSQESMNINKVAKKTQEIKELINNRMTAFLYMSSRCYSSEELNEEVKSFKKSLDRTISYFLENEDKASQVFVKNILDQINGLQKEYEKLEAVLSQTKNEVLNTEEEEEELKCQMSLAENNINRFIIEGEKTCAGCECNLV